MRENVRKTPFEKYFDRFVERNPYFAVEPGYKRNYIQKLLLISSPIFIGLYLNNLLGWLIGWFLSQSRTCEACATGNCGSIVTWFFDVGNLIPNVQIYNFVLRVQGMQNRCFLLNFSYGYYLVFTLLAIFMLGIFIIYLHYCDHALLKHGQKLMPYKSYPKSKWMIIFCFISFPFILYASIFLDRGSPFGFAHYPVVKEEYFSAGAPPLFFAVLVGALMLGISITLGVVLENNRIKAMNGGNG